MRIKLDKDLIIELFKELNEELRKREIRGELYLLGGAVMCLQFNARPSTYDIDALFLPKKEMREIIHRIAENHRLDPDWINDAVKGFLSPSAQYDTYLDLSHLKVFCATAEYLLAMKCLSMRLGAEFYDEKDVRYLLRYLNLSSLDQVLATIEKYYDKTMIPQKAFYALQEFLAE